MRLAVVAAFPFPLPQGSQVFVEQQARALLEAGAQVTLFCYASGSGEPPAGLEVKRIPRALSPRSLRAGPSAGKPLADLALAHLLARAPGPFDAVIAHNGEAALAALLTRRLLRAPLIYVAHTLLGNELDAYAPAWLGRFARGFGDLVDRGVAARSNAVIALSADGARRLGPFARGPLRVIPPGLLLRSAPAAAAIEAACARAGVESGGFALYTGNLDRYQQLDELAEAARLAPELPVVVATHGSGTSTPGPLRVVRTSPDDARALTFGCALAVVPRTRAGGFPVKLLNYMEASRAIVARRGIADGLEHGRSAWLLPRDAGAAELAAAMRTLRANPARAAALGRGARQALQRNHDWTTLAPRTLELIREIGAPSDTDTSNRSPT